jgi:2-iminobutanoate/2-iminopropanoate deaminase
MNMSKRTLLALVVAAIVMSAVALALTVTGCCGTDDADAPPAPTTSVVDESRSSGYSEATRYGDLVWTAGHLPQSASPGDDVATQTKAVMEGLKATLRKAGASFDTVVMTNVYLTNFDDWPKFNQVYETYFPRRLPPRVTVETSGLAFGNIEISMVAHTASP